MDRFLIGFGQVVRAFWVVIAGFMLVSGRGRICYPPQHGGPCYANRTLEGRILVSLFLLLGLWVGTLWLRAMRRDMDQGEVDVDSIWLGKANRPLVLGISSVFATFCILGYYVFRHAALPES